MLRFTLRGSVIGRTDFQTARDKVAAQLTLTAWAAERRPCSGWMVEIDSDAGQTIDRRTWCPRTGRWVRR